MAIESSANDLAPISGLDSQALFRKAFAAVAIIIVVIVILGTGFMAVNGNTDRSYNVLPAIIASLPVIIGAGLGLAAWLRHRFQSGKKGYIGRLIYFSVLAALITPFTVIFITLFSISTLNPLDHLAAKAHFGVVSGSLANMITVWLPADIVGLIFIGIFIYDFATQKLAPAWRFMLLLLSLVLLMSVIAGSYIAQALYSM